MPASKSPGEFVKYLCCAHIQASDPVGLGWAQSFMLMSFQEMLLLLVEGGAHFQDPHFGAGLSKPRNPDRQWVHLAEGLCLYGSEIRMALKKQQQQNPKKNMEQGLNDMQSLKTVHFWPFTENVC